MWTVVKNVDDASKVDASELFRASPARMRDPVS